MAVTGRGPRGNGRDAGAGTSSGRATEAITAAMHYLAVAALAAGVYWNSLDGQFVHDDIVAVVKNDDVTTDTPLVDVLRHDFWGRPISSERSHKSYRPLCVATFRSVSGIFDCFRYSCCVKLTPSTEPVSCVHHD